MEQQSASSAIEHLEPFVGEWNLQADIPTAPPPDPDNPARTVFEWMPGRQFLIQRWEIPIPVAPDGIAIIGFDAGREAILQHYFDTRGVARVYEMTFADGAWELRREKPDFSPLNFWQRFQGKFSDDGNMIVGRWDQSSDGSSWEHDFDLTYTRVG